MPITDTITDDQRSFALIRQGGKMRDQGVTLLYRNYAAHFRKFYLYQGLNAADADDIVQETFFNIVKHCNTYKGNSPLAAWLWRIARNCMINHIRIINGQPTVNLDDEGWDTLEQASDAMHTFDPPTTNNTLEGCVERGFANFAKKSPMRAYALSLQMEGYDTAYIAAATHHETGGIREYLSQCRKRIEEFLLPCRDYLSAV